MAAQPSGEISALGDQTAPMHVVLFGATGTIGRAVLSRLIEGGHTVTCIVRPGSGAGLPADVSVKECRLAPEAISQAFEGSAVDAVISCLASRSGRAADAWAIDHAAHRAILNAAEAAGVGQMILLSALCVQRPKLAFQRAKLAFEAELRASQLNWSIVRPTAFFKSLSGQVERVQRGKPFLVFGDGRLTACKPISDRDLADYIVGCLHDPTRSRRILPIGGPGPAITPLDQAETLFALLGRPPKIRRVPVQVLSSIATGLGLAGRIVPKLADKAELARIGLYYGTESMLVWNEETQRYDADATPSHGQDPLFDFYKKLLVGEASVDLGEHAVF